MNKMKLILPVFVIGLAMTVSNAFGLNGHGERRKPRPALPDQLNQFDTNNDGTISAAEIAAAKETLVNEAKTQLFGKYDTNGDGVITSSEAMAVFDVIANDWVEDLLAHFDRNHDGAISSADFVFVPTVLSDVFKQFDTNGDNVLSADELEAAVQSKA